MPGERSFKEVSVKRMGLQTPLQRFGTTAGQPIDDSDSEDESQGLGDNPTVPKIEYWKMNLTLLSDFYNLYFVAYGTQIYVYRPQALSQALPREPVLIIEPPQSLAGRALNSTAIRWHSHSVNHLRIGELGDEEILLSSHADGDVVAYHTGKIQMMLQASPPSGGHNVQPFFLENVGQSAWGLDIHQQSRLIAVSSNRHEIQVFAFGLSCSSREDSPMSGVDFENEEVSELFLQKERFPLVEQDELPWTPDGELARDHNFRLRFHLHEVGDNMPSVAFSDDCHGNAESIIGIDIKGALWIFQIWEQKWKRLPTQKNGLEANMGWGLIVVSRNFFKPTNSAEDTFGCPVAVACRKGRFDITKSVPLVSDSRVWHDLYDADDDSEDELLNDPDLASTLGPAPEDDDAATPTSNETTGSIFLLTTQQTLGASRPRASPPPTPMPCSTEGDGFFNIKTKHRTISHLVSDGAVILYTNLHSIYLLPTSDTCDQTECHNALRQDQPHDLWFSIPFQYYQRLNMIATIPELSLVLVASQVGRVALLTVTRPVDRLTRVGGLVSMRMELILPLSSEERDKIRPNSGLLGMAVGPTLNRTARSASVAAGPKAWRLMLHYYDHSILSYGIYRDRTTGEVLVT